MQYFVVLVFALFFSAAQAEESPYETIKWDDLMPEGEWDRYDQQVIDFMSKMTVEEGSAQDQARQFGTYNVVSSLDGQKIRLPGFVLPFDYEKMETLTEFLLVPYFGACLHTPPPPPNQIVYVKTDKPIKFSSIWEPIWAEGTIKTEKNLNGLGDAAYTLQLSGWETYKYE